MSFAKPSLETEFACNDIKCQKIRFQIFLIEINFDDKIFWCQKIFMAINFEINLNEKKLAPVGNFSDVLRL